MSDPSREGGTGSQGPVPLSQVECPICGEPTVVNAMGDGRLICSCASHMEIPGGPEAPTPEAPTPEDPAPEDRAPEGRAPEDPLPKDGTPEFGAPDRRPR